MPRTHDAIPGLAIGLALAAAACAIAVVAHAADRQPVGKAVLSAPRPVKVTPEMIGAGVVSSDTVLPPIPPLAASREKPVASWGKPLPYPIVIADRRNNRLIEVAPDKRIVWEFPSPNLRIYRGNDDVFFSPDGKLLVVNEEDNYDIHFVDYDKRELAWTFGASDTKGVAHGYFNFPDDAHLMADGTVVTADIRNCRVLFIDPAKSAVTGQWGEDGRCTHDPPRRLAFPTGDGQVIVADYSKPGKIVIFDPTRGCSTIPRSRSSCRPATWW